MTLLETLVAEPPPLTEAEDGTVRVRGTRVSLDTIVYAYKNGAIPEEIALNFPTVDLSDVHAVIAYYLRHQAEVDSYLEQRRQEAEELRERIESRWPPDGIRERLLARRKKNTQF